MDLPLDPEAVFTFLRNIEISRYLSVASYAFLVYDLALTLPKEIKLVWTAKWSIVKLLFLINRYTVPAAIIINLVSITGLDVGLTVTFCQRAIIILVFWQLISLALVDVIVSLRIHALLHRRRSVFILLSLLFVTAYATTLALASVFFAELFDTIQYTTAIVGPLCSAKPSNYLWTTFVPGLLFESVICAITFARVWICITTGQTPFREAMERDSAMYVLIAFLARLFDMLLWALAPNSLLLLGEHFAFAISSAACSRLLLDLRGVRRPEDWTEATRLLLSPSAAKSPTPDSWLADQGPGQSFLEQIYQVTLGEKPRIPQVEQFVVTA